MRPCPCDRCDVTPGAAYRPGDCRPCWLYHHDPAYRELYSRPPGWGDVVEWLARRSGGAWLARRWARLTGRGCGCGGRKTVLNRLPSPAELWRRLT